MGNNPVMMVDPDGEIAIWAAMAIGAGISGVGYAVNVALSNGGFQNWNWGQFGTSLASGGLSGIITAGIGSDFGALGETASTFGGKALHEVGRAGIHGFSNIAVGNTFGQAPSWSSFTAAGIGSLIGSAAHGLGPLGQIVGSSIAGGIGAELTGGNFWSGAAVGATVAGLNHLSHRLQDSPKTTGKYEKSGKLVGVHRVVSQKDGYTTYADRKGMLFTLDPNGDVVTNSMLSYLPGGKNFHKTNMYGDIRKIQHSKFGQVGGVVINRGTELLFFFRGIPWFINDPVIPDGYIYTSQPQKNRN